MAIHWHSLPINFIYQLLCSSQVMITACRDSKTLYKPAVPNFFSCIPKEKSFLFEGTSKTVFCFPTKFNLALPNVTDIQASFCTCMNSIKTNYYYLFSDKYFSITIILAYPLAPAGVYLEIGRAHV